MPDRTKYPPPPVDAMDSDDDLPFPASDVSDNTESDTIEEDEPAAPPPPAPPLFRSSAVLGKKVPLDWLRDESENENDEEKQSAPIKTKKDGTPMMRKDGAIIRESRPSKLRLLRNNLRRRLRQDISNQGETWVNPRPTRFRASEQRVWKTVVKAAQENKRLPANVDKAIAKVEAKGGTFLQGGHMVFVTLFKAVEFNRLHADLNEQSRELTKLREKSKADELKLKTLKEDNDKLKKQVDSRSTRQKRSAPSATITPAKRQRSSQLEWPDKIREDQRQRRDLKDPHDRKLTSAFDNLDELVDTAIEAIRAEGDPTNEKMKAFINRAENRSIYDFI
ncbi:hypothetical protein B2J93_6959 [Marssonina coronariae]|uniref:Uncharacterized protein n=1 Tax=Diplocarpon coronariae TaxID=2795749 RepID=A0A218YY05_9HELO|nr:hypothetical protein B2J93_6959 [Marssonina coronariae]